MNKKLMEVFELPVEPEETSGENSLLPVPISPETLSNIDKINEALPAVKGLEATDDEMDNLANMATESYESLMEFAMQVDPRFSAEIFGVASNMLGHAITAKTNKITRKLKMIELQLKKAALDKKTSKDDGTPNEEIVPGEGKLLDRNELLRMLSPPAKDK